MHIRLDPEHLELDMPSQSQECLVSKSHIERLLRGGALRNLDLYIFYNPECISIHEATTQGLKRPLKFETPGFLSLSCNGIAFCIPVLVCSAF